MSTNCRVLLLIVAQRITTMFFLFELIQLFLSFMHFISPFRTIYEKLASAFMDETKMLYLQRAEEISPNIRYCAYNLGEDSVDINDLVNLRMSAAGQDLLVAKIDVSMDSTLSCSSRWFEESIIVGWIGGFV